MRPEAFPVGCLGASVTLDGAIRERPDGIRKADDRCAGSWGCEVSVTRAPLDGTPRRLKWVAARDQTP